MKVLLLTPTNRTQIVLEVAKHLRAGKVVAIPTETSYGLAVDATNARAIKQLYLIKGRDFKKPIHVLVSSRAQAKQLIQWNSTTHALVNKFWPGPLTVVAKLKGAAKGPLAILTAGTGFLGVRYSGLALAVSIVKKLGRPITATSANIAGLPDCYAASEVIRQFVGKRNKPDILIDSGTLPPTKPSTVVKVDAESIEVLREGPISKKEIEKII